MQVVENELARVDLHIVEGADQHGDMRVEGVVDGVVLARVDDAEEVEESQLMSCR